jgi:hypothetical protein
VDPPPPLVPGGTHSLEGEEVREGSQFGGGDRHCVTIGIYLLRAFHIGPKETFCENGDDFV